MNEWIKNEKSQSNDVFTGLPLHTLFRTILLGLPLHKITDFETFSYWLRFQTELQDYVSNSKTVILPLILFERDDCAGKTLPVIFW